MMSGPTPACSACGTALVQIRVLEMELNVLAGRNAQLLSRAETAEQQLAARPSGATAFTTSNGTPKEPAAVVDGWTDAMPLVLTGEERAQVVKPALAPLVDGLGAVGNRLRSLLAACSVFPGYSAEGDDACAGVECPSEQACGSSDNALGELLRSFSAVAELIEKIDCSVRSKAAAVASCVSEQQLHLQRLHTEAAEERQHFEEKIRTLEAVATGVHEREAAMKAETLELRASMSLLYEECKRSHVDAQAAEANARQLQIQLNFMRRSCQQEKNKNSVLEKLLERFRVQCVTEAMSTGAVDQLCGSETPKLEQALEVEEEENDQVVQQTLLSTQTAPWHEHLKQRQTSHPFPHHAASRDPIGLFSPEPQQPRASEPQQQQQQQQYSKLAADAEFVQSKIMMLARQIYRRASLSKSESQQSSAD